MFNCRRVLFCNDNELKMYKSGGNTNVVRHTIEHPTHIQAFMTLPTLPQTIFSTLQGTQSLNFAKS